MVSKISFDCKPICVQIVVDSHFAEVYDSVIAANNREKKMANRYEVVDADSLEVVLPACGNVSFENWSDSRCGQRYNMVREMRNHHQDEDCNNVHVYLMRED